MPKCTVIKSEATITSAASEKVAELQGLIDAINVPFLPKAGDICFYNSASEALEIVSYSTWSTDPSKYPIEQYTPVGVVAVPASHNVYGDFKSGVISLKGMDYSTPDEGGKNFSMYWGYNSLLIGKELNQCVVCGTMQSQTVAATGEAGDAYLPSDFFNRWECLVDPKAYYYNMTGTMSASPSPYLEDESKNPAYSQTTDPTSEANCLADFDGVGDTQAILDEVTVSDWQTAETINNSYSSGNYPAACCCWRFHTAGTNQGDWYLPAAGEAGYVVARLKAINASITDLITAYGSEIGVEIDISAYLWSSSEYSNANARYVNMSNGYMGTNGKRYGNYVRAFLRV